MQFTAPICTEASRKKPQPCAHAEFPLHQMNRSYLLGIPRSFQYVTSEAIPAYWLRLEFKNKADITSALSQFFVDIYDVSANRVMFTFSNRVPGMYSITDIYFNDGRLLSIAVDKDSGNDSDAGLNGGISRPASNPNIPGPDNRPSTIHVNRDLLIDKGPVAQQSGYDQCESLAIIFDLQTGIGFADIICALRDGSLRMTIKAKGFEPGNSKILINDSMPTLSHSSYLQ